MFELHAHHTVTTHNHLEAAVEQGFRLNDPASIIYDLVNVDGEDVLRDVMFPVITAGRVVSFTPPAPFAGD